MHGANDSMVPFTESTFSTSKFKNSTLLISFYMNIKKYQPTEEYFLKSKNF